MAKERRTGVEVVEAVQLELAVLQLAAELELPPE